MIFNVDIFFKITFLLCWLTRRYVRLLKLGVNLRERFEGMHAFVCVSTRNRSSPEPKRTRLSHDPALSYYPVLEQEVSPQYKGMEIYRLSVMRQMDIHEDYPCYHVKITRFLCTRENTKKLKRSTKLATKSCLIIHYQALEIIKV